MEFREGAFDFQTSQQNHKNKEIDNANKDKNKISDILKDQQGKEKESQKAVGDFK
ncbi:hypothetical protein [Lactococcus lactis]|uniref:hypothetical protein n=1 Tax=Lactococcus lactis TaxID=1358 RepID=UPI00223AE5A2|nr:hypothetical protein [Lactococcus lactis]